MGATFDPDYVPLTPEQRLLALKKERDNLILQIGTRPNEYWIRNRRVRMEIEQRIDLIEKLIAKVEGTINGCIQRNRTQMVGPARRRSVC